MSLGTLNSGPPPFFKQGPSAFSRLVFFSALALFLMVADVRLKLTNPIRQAVAAVLAPIEWTLSWPIVQVTGATRNVQELRVAQDERDRALNDARSASLQAQRADQLALENQRLRALLELKPQAQSTVIAAEVVYESRDPFTRKFTLDKGSSQGVEAGMPVIDEKGVIGQVTRVYLTSSEVSAITDRDMAIPVQNLRTGLRGVAYGDPSAAGSLELRFTPGNADVKEDDLLATSGLDGVYPAGLIVAKVQRVERRAESPFAKIVCTPLSGLNRGRHVLVLRPLKTDIAPTPGMIGIPGAVPENTKKTRPPKSGSARPTSEPSVNTDTSTPDVEPTPAVPAAPR
jgi:rod shape-determining protein MreC